ncbi:hypothetical protein [Acinetobacter dispersus]|uniref:Uncharacterized protein n=1 Tax=Acinetobacter dispersus TaxID=70348 RepID=N9MHK7_9GAMM|nr:hypothetical protein [Acinetobacter dispersus]ENW92770.1 hypothetical protein F904_02713 [Acinetobacter dispersus]
MPKTIDIAKRVILALHKDPKSVDLVKSQEGLNTDKSAWNRVSEKAYELFLAHHRKQREIDEKSPYILCTSSEDIKRMLKINNILANYALTFRSDSTLAEINDIERLCQNLPHTEHEIIEELAKKAMHPVFRAEQKLGRFEVLLPFKEFAVIIESAVLSFYRSNFIAAYLTLIPTIEGIISRWLALSGVSKKPDFEDFRKFFSNGYSRNPCPGNLLFYDIYSKACDQLLSDHFYKPSTAGDAYSNFNRHLAAHLLKDEIFATMDNCIRLFLILDTMAELYILETHNQNARFYLTEERKRPTVELYKIASLNFVSSPETILLNKIQ